MFDAIRAASQRLQGHAHRTPIMTSRTLDERAGAEVFLKCENLQRVGAFKFRGAYNAISQLSDAERARGVITYSSGNHAQAVALACRMLGAQAVIVMPAERARHQTRRDRGLWRARRALRSRDRRPEADRGVVGRRARLHHRAAV